MTASAVFRGLRLSSCTLFFAAFVLWCSGAVLVIILSPPTILYLLHYVKKSFLLTTLLFLCCCWGFAETSETHQYRCPMVEQMFVAKGTSCRGTKK